MTLDPANPVGCAVKPGDVAPGLDADEAKRELPNPVGWLFKKEF